MLTFLPGLMYHSNFLRCDKYHCHKNYMEISADLRKSRKPLREIQKCVSDPFNYRFFFYIPWRYAITLLIVSEQSKKVCQPHFSHLKHLVETVVQVKTQGPKAALE